MSFVPNQKQVSEGQVVIKNSSTANNNKTGNIAYSNQKLSKTFTKIKKPGSILDKTSPKELDAISNKSKDSNLDVSNDQISFSQSQHKNPQSRYASEKDKSRHKTPSNDEIMSKTQQQISFQKSLQSSNSIISKHQQSEHLKEVGVRTFKQNKDKSSLKIAGILNSNKDAFISSNSKRNLSNK